MSTRQVLQTCVERDRWASRKCSWRSLHQERIVQHACRFHVWPPLLLRSEWHDCRILNGLTARFHAALKRHANRSNPGPSASGLCIPRAPRVRVIHLHHHPHCHPPGADDRPRWTRGNLSTPSRSRVIPRSVPVPFSPMPAGKQRIPQRHLSVTSVVSSNECEHLVVVNVSIRHRHPHRGQLSSAH